MTEYAHFWGRRAYYSEKRQDWLYMNHKPISNNMTCGVCGRKLKLITISIPVDSCIRKEMYDLKIVHNIKTRSCCCGHGITDGWVVVEESEKNKMLELGYVMEDLDIKNGYCFVLKTEVK